MNFNRTVVSVFDFHSEELPGDAQVLHFESFAKLLLDRSYIILVVTRNNEVVNVKRDVRLLTVRVGVNEYAGIGIALLEIETDDDGSDSLEPSSRGLF